MIIGGYIWCWKGSYLFLVILLVLWNVYNMVQVLVLVVLELLKLVILGNGLVKVEIVLLLFGTWSCNEYGP